MKEAMSAHMNQVRINEAPIKTAGAPLRSHEELQAQADRIMQARKEVNYSEVRGTCVDERPRVGLKSGEPTVEARPSVHGGPDIYGLYIAELTGFFGKDSRLTPAERLRSVKREINRAGIKSGGHEHCAAAGSFGDVVGIIANNPDAVSAYAQQELGEKFVPDAMKEVLDNAQDVVASKRYNGISMEDVLVEELGDEAGEAIERLADVPHKALTLGRNKREGTTIDATTVHNLGGEDSFTFDDPYADRIDNALTAGPDASWKLVVAAHAREASLAAVANAVPNEELYQINLS